MNEHPAEGILRFTSYMKLHVFLYNAINPY